MSGSNLGSLFEFSKDLNDAEAPKPLPAGPYPAEIIGAQARVSGAGNTYAAITIRIPSSAYPADHTDGDPDGTVLSYNRLLLEDSAQSQFRWKKFLLSIGAPLSRSIDLNTLIGRTCIVEVNHQEYEGEQRAQIARILSA
jgi:hypothetical protein